MIKTMCENLDRKIDEAAASARKKQGEEVATLRNQVRVLCGILLGDDYMRDWPGVVRAADQLAAIGEFQVVRPKLPNATQGARANVDGRYGVKWWAQRVGCPRITLPA